MPRPTSGSLTPHAVRHAAVCVAFVLAAIVCAQCRPIEDTITGVDMGVHSGSARPPVCLHGCVDRFQRGHRDEEARHRRAVRNCRRDRACTTAERAVHRERKAALAAVLRDCRRGCYGEGAGALGR